MIFRNDDDNEGSKPRGAGYYSIHNHDNFIASFFTNKFLYL